MKKPLLVIIAAPSGAGKSTLCDRLVAALPGLKYSVSCTTRSPRGKEVDGVDYFFLSEADFQKKMDDGEFLEYANVHGYLYGTLRKTVEETMLNGCSVLLDIDVQGARQVRENCRETSFPQIIREGYVDIFISPPSMQELQRRLETRGEDAPDVIMQRLKNAAGEMACADEFRYQLVNDDLEAAFARLKEIIESEEGK